MNKVVLIGRLTKDPELRHIASTGRAVCNFTLAVDRQLGKDKKAEYQQKGISTADFIRVNVWGKTAEVAAQYLRKGHKVAIDGQITSGSYKTNDGETRYTTEVTVNQVEFLEKANSQTASDQEQGMYDPGDFSGSYQDNDEVPF